MQKDPKRNADGYQTRAGQINEFEFDKNQAALAEQKPRDDAKLIPGTPPEQRAEGLRPVVARKAAKKAAGKSNTMKTKAPKKAAVAIRGASAKKLAARKAARKN